MKAVINAISPCIEVKNSMDFTPVTDEIRRLSGCMDDVRHSVEAPRVVEMLRLLEAKVENIPTTAPAIELSSVVDFLPVLEEIQRNKVEFDNNCIKIIDAVRESNSELSLDFGPVIEAVRECAQPD